MKRLMLAAIRCSLMVSAVATSLFPVRPAQAYTVTLEQIGSNVVANGSGAINLTGLTIETPFFKGLPGVHADFGVIATGSPESELRSYRGFTGPTSFGSGGLFIADSGSGDFVEIDSIEGLLFVPIRYMSGAALSDSMTFDNATFASLGVTPGTYVWSWGTGLPHQNFTLIIGGVGVPDGGSTVSLLSFASIGLVALRRRLGLLKATQNEAALRINLSRAR